MTVDPIAAVLAPPAYQLLEQLTGHEDAATVLADADVDATTRAALLTQLELRERGVEKFGKWAAQLLFTRDGLEQATHLQIAALHAQRYLDAGVKVVADLGCGIGANAFALAGLGLQVRAWDRDPQAVAAALVNLRFFPDCTVQLGDVTDLSVQQMAEDGVEAIFADPARRTGAKGGNRRILDPHKWSPTLDQVLGWGQTLAEGGVERLGVKVAPGLDYRFIPSHYQAQWISRGNAVADASLWSPGLAPEGPGRTAVALSADGPLRLSFDGDPQSPAERVPVGKLGEYLWEPDGAVIRAGTLAQFAASAGASGCVSENIAYLTADAPPAGQWARATACFRVLDVVPLKTKTLTSAVREFCAERAVSSVEVKKRGAQVDPGALQKQLNKVVRTSGGKVASAAASDPAAGGAESGKTAGPTASGAATTASPTAPAPQVLTVVLTRVAGRHRAILCERCH